MKYIKEYAFSALAILMASCSSDSDTIEPEAQKTPVASSGTMSFSASIESGETASKATRTSLADANTTSPYPIWSSGDQIKVLNTTTEDAQLFSITSSDVGKRAANFTGNIKVETGNNANNKFYAFYAGNVGASTGAPTISMSGSNVTVSGTIPSVQSSTPAFNPNLHFMTACTTGTAFSFKNAMALLKLTISENNYANFQIRKIVFKSKGTDKIAGDFTANISDNGTLTNYVVADNANASSEITIGDGSSALSTGTYYIAIHPCVLSSGFTLTFENTEDGAVYERSRATSFTIANSEIIDLGSYTAQACAKEAYVDLGLTNSEGKSILWCVENIYDDGFTDTDSFYSWGETSVKANQTKVDLCKYYSWYYDYGVGEGSDNSDITVNLNKRCYKYGLGPGAINDAVNAENRYEFIYSYYAMGVFKRTQYGILLKYNSYSTYGGGTITDWGSGVTDAKTVLDDADDAAYQKSNGKWRIPTSADFETLINSSTTINANNQFVHSDRPLVAGPAAGSNNTKYKFKNRTTGHYIILPLKGYRFRSKESESNDNPKNTSYGYYWTRNLADADADSYKAKALKVDAVASESGNLFDGERAAGLMIRGVMYK